MEIPLGSGEINIYSVDNIKLPPRATVSFSVKSASTEQQNGTLHQIIPAEEILLENEDMVLVESVVRRNSTREISEMFASLGHKTVKWCKREKTYHLYTLENKLNILKCTEQRHINAR